MDEIDEEFTQRWTDRYPRSWRQRWLSWPWRPWVREYAVPKVAYRCLATNGPLAGQEIMMSARSTSLRVPRIIKGAHVIRVTEAGGVEPSMPQLGEMIYRRAVFEGRPYLHLEQP